MPPEKADWGSSGRQGGYEKLSDEYDAPEQAHETTYGEFKIVRDDLHRLEGQVMRRYAARFNERTEEQKLQNRPKYDRKRRNYPDELHLSAD